MTNHSPQKLQITLDQGMNSKSIFHPLSSQQIHYSERKRREQFSILIRCVLGIVASNVVFSPSLLAEDQTLSTTCQFWNIEVKCNVEISGERIILGGFQAAPIFTRDTPWKASDHRGNIYEIIKGTNYTLFKPTTQEGTGIRVEGLRL